jgi:polygalacturonase
LHGFIIYSFLRLSNIVFNGTEYGARIKTDQGGAGFVRDITYQNIVTHNVETTLYITMYYSGSGSTSMHIYDIYFTNITAYNSANAGSFICMSNLPCENIIMDNVIHIGDEKPWYCQDANGHATNVTPTSCL